MAASLWRCMLFLLWGLGAVSSFAQEAEKPRETSSEERPRKQVKLSAAMDNVIVGGAGQYLIAHLKSVQKLAVVEVPTGKVAKYLSLPTNDILYTAGADKLFIVLKEQNIIQRYSLATLEREVAAPLPADMRPSSLTMGHASAGPILMGFEEGGGFRLVHAKTLKPIELKSVRESRGFDCSSRCVVRAAANGQVFTSWRTSVSPSGFHTLVVNGDRVEAHYEHHSDGLLSPSPDGARIYTSVGTYTNAIKPISDRRNNQRPLPAVFPSVTGEYYVRYERPDFFGKQIQSLEMTFYLANYAAPVLTIPNPFRVPPPESSFHESNMLMADRRLFLFPDCDILALVNEEQDGFDFMTIDLDAELDKSSIDYLFVTSRAPTTTASGKPFHYQMVVKSKKQGVKLSLVAAPEGMQLDAMNNITWNVPAREKGEVDIIVAVTDASQQEIFHTFRLNIGDAPPGTTISTALAVRPADVAAADKNLPSSPSAQDSSLTPARFSGDRLSIRLPAKCAQMRVGGNGRYLVVHLPSLRKLAVIDVCTTKISGYIPVDDDYVQFAAGLHKVVVGLGDKRVLARWDLATLKRELSIASETSIGDLVLGSASEGPVLLLSGGDGTAHGRLDLRFLELEKFRELPVESPERSNIFVEAARNYVRASSDGRTFFACLSFAPAVLQFDGQKMRTLISQNHKLGRQLVPGPDGQVLYGAGGLRYSSQFQPLNAKTGPGTMNDISTQIPAIHGHLYVSVVADAAWRHDTSRAQKLTVHIVGDERALVTLEDFQLFPENRMTPQAIQELDKRLAIIPDAKVVAMVMPGLDTLELRRFDLDAALEASAADYLFVSSRPPSVLQLKDTLSYQLAVKSKKGGLKYRLESGPAGMAISDQGLLTWKADGALGLQTVVVAIADAAEQEVFHTFSLMVEGPKPANVANAAVVPPVTSPRQRDKPSESVGKTPVVGQKRQWTDASSGRAIEAEFLALADDKVTVRLADGREVQLPLERLSREDLLWILNAK